MYKLYSMRRSGNSYKVRLALAQLDIAHELVEIDILQGETRTPEFLKMNPSGHVPVLEVTPGNYIAESNAILWYFGEGTRFLPEDAYERAQVLQWMFFEQYEHEPALAVARFWLSYSGKPDEFADRLPGRQAAGRRVLAAMDGHLEGRSYLVGDSFTIADISLYAYTHVAPEAGVELEPYGAVRAWLARVAAQPRHVPIDA